MQGDRTQSLWRLLRQLLQTGDAPLPPPMQQLLADRSEERSQRRQTSKVVGVEIEVHLGCVYACCVCVCVFVCVCVRARVCVYSCTR